MFRRDRDDFGLPAGPRSRFGFPDRRPGFVPRERDRARQFQDGLQRQQRPSFRPPHPPGRGFTEFGGPNIPASSVDESMRQMLEGDRPRRAPGYRPEFDRGGPGRFGTSSLPAMPPRRHLPFMGGRWRPAHPWMGMPRRDSFSDSSDDDSNPFYYSDSDSSADSACFSSDDDELTLRERWERGFRRGYRGGFRGRQPAGQRPMGRPAFSNPFAGPRPQYPRPQPHMPQPPRPQSFHPHDPRSQPFGPQPSCAGMHGQQRWAGRQQNGFPGRDGQNRQGPFGPADEENDQRNEQRRQGPDEPIRPSGFESPPSPRGQNSRH